MDEDTEAVANEPKASAEKIVMAGDPTESHGTELKGMQEHVPTIELRKVIQKGDGKVHATTENAIGNV